MKFGRFSMKSQANKKFDDQWKIAIRTKTEESFLPRRF